MQLVRPAALLSLSLVEISLSEAGWLEISFIVDGEMAEAVAEVIARFIPEGVVIESTTIEDDESEGHIVGPLRVAGYLPIDDQLQAVRQQLEEALWYLSRIRPLPAPKFQVVQQADWAEAWKQHYQPIAVGRKLMIVPAWLDASDGDRTPICIDPGMAFGTGTHPTTQLCLEIIEDLIADLIESKSSDPIDVIDLGCGSGILSIAAIKLGAERALGLDIDAQAVRTAQANLVANHLTNEVELVTGSLAEILSGQFALHNASLVLANILAPVLISLLEEGLGNLLTQDGYLVLSGILKEQAETVEAAIQHSGLTMFDQRQKGDWVALVAKL